MNRANRLLVVGAALAVMGVAAHRTQSARAQDQAPEVTVYKSPT